MPVNLGFFASKNYFGLLSEVNTESKNHNREERQRGPTLNPAMKDESFISDLKEWSRDYGNPESKDYIPFSVFLDRYPSYFPKSTGTGQIPVENCYFEPEWFTYPVEAIDMTLDKQSANSLPSGTHFERCKFISENDTSALVLENNSLFNCEFLGNFDKSEISHCDLESIDYTRASLRSGHFKKSSLIGVDFSGANLQESRFDNTNVTACNFANANMGEFKAIKNTNFYASNFQKVNMRGFHLGSGPAKKNKPDESSMNNCDLTDADLRVGTIHCNAVLEETVFNPAAAAKAAQLYLSYFPSDTNCFLPHIGLTCTNLYDDRVHAMVNASGDSSLICTDMMPASSCGSDVRSFAFKKGVGHYGQDGKGSSSYTDQSILYGQPGNDTIGVQYALQQEGMNHVDLTRASDCTTEGETDVRASSGCLSCLSGLLSL